VFTNVFLTKFDYSNGKSVSKQQNLLVFFSAIQKHNKLTILMGLINFHLNCVQICIGNKSVFEALLTM